MHNFSDLTICWEFANFSERNFEVGRPIRVGAIEITLEYANFSTKKAQKFNILRLKELFERKKHKKHCSLHCYYSGLRGLERNRLLIRAHKRACSAHYYPIPRS